MTFSSESWGCATNRLCAHGLPCWHGDVPEMMEHLRRQEWTVVRGDGFDDMRDQNIRFWQSLGGAEIRRAAWELVTDYWDANKLPLDELRFSRSVTAVRRT